MYKATHEPHELLSAWHFAYFDNDAVSIAGECEWNAHALAQALFFNVYT